MKSLSHHLAAMSIAAFAVAGAFAPLAAATPSPYYGRWVTDEPNRAFTARGREYRSIDIAPCGRDFCGVSVGDKGTCGPVLFRFLTKHADGEDQPLRGHGKWGKDTKNVVIYHYENDPADGGKQIELYLGKGYDFGGRSDSMPSFHSVYLPKGKAACTAR